MYGFATMMSPKKNFIMFPNLPNIGEKTIPEQKKSSTVSENKNVTCLLDTQVFIPETLGHKFPQVELLIVPRTTVFVIVIEKLRGSTCYCRALNAHGFCGGKP